MKPDAFLKLYPGDWLKDTMHLDATATGAYFLLILAHRGKPGIPNDDATLMAITRVREQDWMRVKGQIAAFFQDAGGLWINSRSVKDWKRDCAEYDAACERTRAATKARTENVTLDVTKNVTSTVTRTQSESESESEAESLINKQGVAPPTLQQVKTKAEFIGMPAEEAEAFWNHFESTGWIDKNGNLIVKWENKLATWKTSNQAKRYQDRQESKAGISAAQSVLYSKEYDRVCDKLRKLEDGAASDAMGSKYYSASDKAMIQKLRARKAELRKILNIVI